MGDLSTDVQQGGAVASAAPMDSGGLLAQIVAAATNPAVDASKMQAMADLALRLQGHEQQQSFNKDLNAAIMEMPVISKAGRIEIRKDGRVIQSTPFAKFEDIDRVVRPICARHNLSYSFEVGGDKGTITVRPIIRHANGHVERGEAMPLPIESSGSKNPVQGSGSSVTYGKRYALCAAFSIMTEGLDMDGHNVRDVVLPHEREDTVMREARAAQAGGIYQEWFMRQSPRDRAWLVQSGNHTQLGGNVITDQSGSNAPDRGPSPSRDDPPPQQQPSGPPKARGTTPAEWTTSYIRLIRATQTIAEYRDIQAANNTGRLRVADADQDEWESLTAAEAEVLDSFAGGDS